MRRITIDQIVSTAGKKYFINAGSVGQPRDRDWRAAYCIYHCERNVVEQRRVEYDLDTTQRKIREAGLPERLADRLAAGTLDNAEGGRRNAESRNSAIPPSVPSSSSNRVR